MARSGAAAQVGSELGGVYRLNGVLGRGGMGVVYAAEHAWTGRRVAVKVIARDGAEPRATERALNEARLAARLRHPNVVDVLDMGEVEPGVLYLAMEYLEGRPLSALVAEQRLEPRTTLELLLPIVGAVAVAHDAGIVHRDLKPSNLFVCERENGRPVPKLLDFGIAKVAGQETLTESGAVVGTPHYMAPEQAADGEASAATDIWALGVVLHQCLRGQRPYEAGSAAAILLKIVNAPAPRLHAVAPWVPKALAAVVDRALEREPARRFRSARDLARALLAAAIQDGVPIPEDPDPIGLPQWKGWRSELESATLSSVQPPLRASLDPAPVALPSAPREPRSRIRVSLALGLGAAAAAAAAGAWFWAGFPWSPGPPASQHVAPARAAPKSRGAELISPPVVVSVTPAAEAPPAPRSSSDVRPPVQAASAPSRPALSRTQPRAGEHPAPNASASTSAPLPAASGIPDLVHEW